MRQRHLQLAFATVPGSDFIEKDDLKEAIVKLAKGCTRGFVVQLIQFQWRQRGQILLARWAGCVGRPWPLKRVHCEIDARLFAEFS